MRLQHHCLKLSLTLGLFLLISIKSIAQIDSVFVNVSFTLAIDPNTSETVHSMHCAVNVYPLSNFGFITLSVIEAESETLVAHFSMTKSELLNAGLLVGNTITLNAEQLNPALDYTIETHLRTDQGAFIPKIIDYYEAP